MRPSPFPVLEFRLANELYDVAAGEISGAQVNAVVVIEGQQDGEEVSEELAKQINNERLKRTARAKKTSLTKNPFSSVTELSSHSNVSSSTDTTSIRSASFPTSYLQSLPAFDKTKHYFGNKKMKIDEEESGSSVIVPRMIFPNSPLITRNTHSSNVFGLFVTLLMAILHCFQQLQNNGYLKMVVCGHENGTAMKLSARLFVSIKSFFTGVSNISAASVYRQKVYDYVDLVIGYQFVNPLYRGRTGKLKVDLSLINDVVEQNGGGGETLNVIE
eukprot:CCRYP_020702-RB/>CCRYP_020702-RB protein AED:0.33 eAED:0.33 QI:0/0/0/1/0/0/2/0/272